MAKQEFSKILVPVDGSEGSMQAANLAIGVAARYGAKIIAIHVINVNQYLQTLGFYSISYPDTITKMVNDAKQEASKWFTEIQRNAEQAKVEVSTDVIDTPLSVVGGIVNYAERENVDLIVIGTRGRSGFTKLLLGSVASGVVAYAPCPVMVAR
ncbi:MAG: universal stress protein [Nitrososphaera sp.]|uniref:universal stress protein n=1 Tax=Nitrososphaera sp. TaxID=1971748 RepID=UPI0017E62E15|nr:universal stress protein [Nitrososphaera sp.]NWG37743.1 universal stress protein [Nitrososphaera sp.]